MIVFACKEYEAKISALIDDELTESESREVLEHITQCPACKTYWEELLAVGNILREEGSAPTGFADAVMARVHETVQETTVPQRKVLRFPGWKRFSGLAAALAVIVLGARMLGGSPLGLDDYAVNNSAAPESYALADGGADSRCAEDTLETAGFSNETDTITSDLPPEAGDASDEAATDTLACGCTAAIVTSSELAEQWVADNLGKSWKIGESYPLSEEQYNALRQALQDAGESFSEIMGNAEGSSYLLLAE